MSSTYKALGSRITLRSSGGSKLKVKSFKSDIRKKNGKVSKLSDAKDVNWMFPKQEELEEDFKNDAFTYCLHDEVVDTVLDKIRRKRLKEEAINGFVECFCKAWLKLVRWRWMMMDTNNASLEETEPKGCPKDNWSSYSNCEPTPERPRSTLPPPRKCCQHPTIRRIDEQLVNKPLKERLRRITKQMREETGVAWGPLREPCCMHRTRCKRKGSSDLLGYSVSPIVSKTAFPERAFARICMGPQVRAESVGLKMHVSTVDLYNSTEPTRAAEATARRNWSKQFSRLDLKF